MEFYCASRGNWRKHPPVTFTYTILPPYHRFHSIPSYRLIKVQQYFERNALNVVWVIGYYGAARK